MVDVKVTLFDGSYHEVDSSEMAFKIAGSMAVKEAAHKASPVLLEPMMAVEVVVPEEYMGTIIGDLNSRRGRIEGMEIARYYADYQGDGAADRRCSVMRPRSALAHAGPRQFTMHFGRYEEVPRIAEEIISQGSREGYEVGARPAKGAVLSRRFYG